MLFNSIEFLLFLPVFFVLYWSLNKQLRLQNLLVLAGSYLFYGWWDWRFLGLIILSSFVDFFIGQQIEKNTDQKKRFSFLLMSVCVNLGVLGFFKYYNFFVESAADLLQSFGMNPNVSTLNIILPVGISFYTFQTLSYTVDVYRGKLKASEDIVGFFAFVSFFPQLVAGPIERATNLLPQFAKSRNFDKALAIDGIYQMLWGFFKKMVVADNCSLYVDEIFANYETLSATYLLLGAFYFAFQIYGDFSGYSDIAIGTAKLLGIRLMVNFSYPYFSRDIAEFWRRWHISLSTWFRDYLYIPLGGSRGGTGQKLRNTIIIFAVSGFWHGANWTYIVWGLLNGLYFIPLLLAGQNRKHVKTIVAEHTWFPSFKELSGMLITFLLTILAWIFFRAPNVQVAFDYVFSIFTDFQLVFPTEYAVFIPLVLIQVGIEWFSRTKEHPLVFKQPFQWRNLAFCSILFWMIAVWGYTGEKEFIYFQF